MDIATVLLHQANRTLADFRGKFVRLGLVHGSILSRVGVSSKPGAVHARLGVAQEADDLLFGKMFLHVQSPCH